jgi:hypothetical protein
MFDNVLVFLQICTHLVKSEPGPHSDSCRTYDDDGGGDKEVTAFKMEEDTHVDTEQNPVPITFKSIKSENEVSIFCVSIIQ